jgi:HAD superfamily hydrolase (TIGR01450 family)
MEDPMHRRAPRTLLLDLDGVLYHGDCALPGAAAFLAAIAHLPHGFVTNNPIRTPREVADHLARLGLPRPEPDQILTSAQATADWLARAKAGFRYFAVGAEGLHRELERVGTPDMHKADFVVVGEGPGLDFEQLTIGINLICGHGARLVATNPDSTVDAVRDGRHLILPGGGALVAPFAVATGVTDSIGKPEPLLYQMALQRLGRSAAECLMVGDRPDTDIAGAARLGMGRRWCAAAVLPPVRPGRTGCRGRIGTCRAGGPGRVARALAGLAVNWTGAARSGTSPRRRAVSSWATTPGRAACVGSARRVYGR